MLVQNCFINLLFSGVRIPLFDINNACIHEQILRNDVMSTSFTLPFIYLVRNFRTLNSDPWKPL